MAVEGGSSVIQLQGHDLPVDDVMCGITVGNIDSRVLTDGLGQSLFEPLLEGTCSVRLTGTSSCATSTVS